MSMLLRRSPSGSVSSSWSSPSRHPTPQPTLRPGTVGRRALGALLGRGAVKTSHWQGRTSADAPGVLRRHGEHGRRRAVHDHRDATPPRRQGGRAEGLGGVLEARLRARVRGGAVATRRCARLSRHCRGARSLWSPGTRLWAPTSLRDFPMMHFAGQIGSGDSSRRRGLAGERRACRCVRDALDGLPPMAFSTRFEASGWATSRNSRSRRANRRATPRAGPRRRPDERLYRIGAAFRLASEQKCIRCTELWIGTGCYLRLQ